MIIIMVAAGDIQCRARFRDEPSRVSYPAYFCPDSKSRLSESLPVLAARASHIFFQANMASATPYVESYISGPQKTEFYTRTYAASPPKAVLIAVHGFNEHIGRFAHIHPSFAARGISVFAFDQRGFGLTAKKNGGYAKTSWKEQLEDIEWALEQGRGLEGCKDLPVFLQGHSMVGCLTI